MSDFCRIIPKKKMKEITLRLSEDEIDCIDWVCWLKDLSYEQLFPYLARKELDKMGVKERNETI